MLEIKLNETKLISEDGLRIILSDTTGNYGDISYIKNDDESYSQVTNTTGYGEPNQARNTLAIVAVGKKLGVSKDTDVVFDDYSPSSASEFMAVVAGDGVYKFWLIKAVYDVSPVVSNYSEGDLIYNGTTRQLVLVESNKLVVKQASDFINTIHSSASMEFPHLVKAGELYTTLVSKSVELRKNKCSDKDINQCVKAIDDISHGIYAMEYEYCKGNKINAISIADYLNNKDYTNVLNL